MQSLRIGSKMYALNRCPECGRTDRLWYIDKSDRIKCLNCDSWIYRTDAPHSAWVREELWLKCGKRGFSDAGMDN